MSTQEDRLLIHPKFADPEDPGLKPIRNMDFPMLLKEAIRLELGGDPWDTPDLTSDAPGTYLAPPPVEITPANSLDASLKSLSAVQTQVPVASPSPKESSHRDVLVEKDRIVGTHDGNTPFPSEGVLIGGGPTHPSIPQEEDPWAIKPKLGGTVVKVGAVVKMGG